MRWFDGRDPAEAFVQRRIDNVMTFEKWKAGKDLDAPLRKATEWLGGCGTEPGYTFPLRSGLAWGGIRPRVSGRRGP